MTKGMSKVKRQSEVWGLCVIVLPHVQSSLTGPDIKAREEEGGGGEEEGRGECERLIFDLG